MNRRARWVFAVALLQTALLGVYWLVEHERAPRSSERLGTEPPRRVDRPMPSLTVVHRDGTSRNLASSGHRTLVHFWATWCPPCRAELPGLLNLASRHDLRVVAVALDQNWEDVARFVGPLDSQHIVRASSEDVERALSVQALPVTFLMEANGRLTLRFDGARNWTDKAFVRTYIEDRAPGQ